MPSSNLVSVSNLIPAIYSLEPKSILEIGVGFGKIGFLVREYLDLRENNDGGYAPWNILIDGIEIYEKYITPIHGYIYDNIYIGNAIDILSKKDFPKYDLIVLADVIEHLKKSDGKKLLELCFKTADSVIISTPYIFYKQDECYGNDAEQHLSGWDINEFRAMGAKYVWISGILLFAVFTNKVLNHKTDIFLDDLLFVTPQLHHIKDLITVYLSTDQYDHCIEACEKYEKFFKDDSFFSNMKAVALNMKNKDDLE
ncbi:hypothetical protein [Clostridium sp. Marseille-QA1073]